MTVLGIRFCAVGAEKDAAATAGMMDEGFGFAKTDFGMETEGFAGAVFPAGEHSWIEMWAEAEGMPAGIMLHVVVDDSDAYAERAKAAGIAVQGPMDAHGERIWFCETPLGFNMAILSKQPAA